MGRQLTFINGFGNTLVLSTQSEAITEQEAINKLDGFEQSFNVNAVTERSPFQQGSTTVSIQANRRFMSFNLHLFKESQETLYERVNEIIDFFNPYASEITMVYTNPSERSRRILMRYNSHKLIDETNIVGYGILSLFIEADDAFFEDLLETKFQFGGETPLFEFPFELPAEFGESALDDIIINTGNYTTPVILEFFGPTTNPKIFRDVLDIQGNVIRTDSLQFELGVTSNEKLIVNTETGKESALIIDLNTGEETNVNRFLSADSVYWKLFLGVNVIRFTIETGTPQTFISYRQKYISA